jgi:omega-amidase
MKITISLAQMNIRLGQPEENFSCAAKMISEAYHRGSQMVILPELWTSGYDLTNRAQYSRLNVNVLAQIQDLAQEFKLWVGGSTIREEDGKYYNSFSLHSPEAAALIRYDKLHLFPLMDEHLWFAPGGHRQLAALPAVSAGLEICYDLRFPELARCYALEGAKLLLIPAEWPAARIVNWQILLRARAIENQVFVAACNCVGKSGAELFGGRSALIAPNGDVLAEASGSEEELLTAEIDLNLVDTVRTAIPVYQDRRPEVY